MSIFDKYVNIEDLISVDALNARKDGLERLIEGAKADIASYEEQLQNIIDRLKDFASTTVDTVQDKAEEAVDAVKEEVKKAAPKRTTKKAAAKTEDVAVEESDNSNTDK